MKRCWFDVICEHFARHQQNPVRHSAQSLSPPYPLLCLMQSLNEHPSDHSTSLDQTMEVIEVEEEEEERLTSPPPAAEVWTIRLRGNLGGMKEVSVPVKTTDEVGTIVDFVNNVIDPSAEREYARIIHKGKTLALTGTVEGSGMKNGDQVGVMFSKRHEIEAMNKTDSMKPSRLMRSFEEEEEIHRRRIEGQNSAEAASYWGEVQDERHKFFKFETVPRFVEPHPYEADRLLLKLATDPGIKFVMKKYQFSVFKLCEMVSRRASSLSKRRDD